MSNLLPLRILHISDLHFRSEVTSTSSLGTALTASPADEFLLRLERKRDTNEFGANQDEWPKALIVSGDLIDKGADPAKYARAGKFLNRLANLFAINSKMVFVVPGNHDVDWSANASGQQETTAEQRLTPFLQQMSEFTCPRVSKRAAYSRVHWSSTITTAGSA